MRNKARMAVVVAVLAGSTIATAQASAASVTVTGDAGTPVPIADGSTTPLRNMKADIAVAPAAGERYRLAVTGPAGQAAASLDCYTIPTSDRLDYFGNGNYTGTLQVYTTSGCSGTPKSTMSFTIAVNASVAINLASPTKALTRQPNGGSYITHQIPVAQNPGALSTQVHYARNGVLGPDGGLTGASERSYVDAATGVGEHHLPPAGHVRAGLPRGGVHQRGLLAVERARHDQGLRAVRLQRRVVPRQPGPGLQAARGRCARRQAAAR